MRSSYWYHIFVTINYQYGSRVHHSVPTFVAGDETSLRHRVVRRPVRDEHPASRRDDGREVGAGAAQAGQQLGAVPVPVAHLQVVVVTALCRVSAPGKITKKWRAVQIGALTRIHPGKEVEIGYGGDVQLGYVQNDLLAVGGEDAPFAGVPLIMRI